ncbi:MAG: phosphatase PAP2 family protein [Pseudomonadota bacterium]
MIDGIASALRPRPTARVASCLAVYAIFFGCYGAVNRFLPLSWGADWTNAIDRALPFLPELVWFFCLVYPLIAVPALVTRSRRQLARTTLAFAVLVVFSCILFVLVPVRIERPAIVSSGLSERMLAFLFDSDRPVCCFPSLHVSAAVLATAALFRERRRWGWCFLPFAVVASLSTLFVKQHVIADVAGGLVLGLLVDWTILGNGDLLANLGRFSLILARFVRRRSAEIAVSRRRSPAGTEYDLYELPSSRLTVVVVHGMCPRGERDERLVPFARSLAAAGCRVVAPALPGLKDYRVERVDVEALVDVVLDLRSAAVPARLSAKDSTPPPAAAAAAAAAEFAVSASSSGSASTPDASTPASQQPLVVVGFSFGAGLALVAATDARVSGCIDSLLLFGPYHSLEEVWSSLSDHPPERLADWDGFVFSQLVLAHRLGAAAFANEADHAEAEELLANYCSIADVASKRAFFERALSGRGVVAKSQHLHDRALLAELSPAGRLAQLGARVHLIHDRNDPVIPASHARRLHAELAERRVEGGQDVLVTSVLSHVTPSALAVLRRLPELVRILATFGEVLGTAPRIPGSNARTESELCRRLLCASSAVAGEVPVPRNRHASKSEGDS